jgi:hypothetical protein
MTAQRHVRGPFVANRISASRVDKYLGCGVQFKRAYIDREPAQMSGSAALFGSVMHRALETWAMDRQRDLVPLVAQAWMEETKGTVVQEFIGAYQRINIEVMHAEADARKAWEAEPRNRGKTSKSPRMTKHFKDSAAAGKLNALLGAWIPKLNAESPWRFSESDPLPNLYDESLRLGKKYAETWRHLPDALYTEFGFDVEWNGFVLNGYIDVIEPLVDHNGELQALLVTDYKTYAKEPPEQKDWRQGCIYDIAVRWLIEQGVLDLPSDLPIYIVFDYVRLGFRRDFSYTQADHEKLLGELRLYKAGVEAEIFLPANKSSNPDYCDYPESCCLRTAGEGCGQRGGLYEDPEE